MATFFRLESGAIINLDNIDRFNPQNQTVTKPGVRMYQVCFSHTALAPPMAFTERDRDGLSEHGINLWDDAPAAVEPEEPSRIMVGPALNVRTYDETKSKSTTAATAPKPTELKALQDECAAKGIEFHHKHKADTLRRLIYKHGRKQKQSESRNAQRSEAAA